MRRQGKGHDRGRGDEHSHSEPPGENVWTILGQKRVSVEPVGVALSSNTTARYIGTAAGLLVPSESLWQLASHHMQPPIVRDLGIGPFSPTSVPSPAMVAWAAGYVLIALAVALRLFHPRDL